MTTKDFLTLETHAMLKYTILLFLIVGANCLFQLTRFGTKKKCEVDIFEFTLELVFDPKACYGSGCAAQLRNNRTIYTTRSCPATEGSFNESLISYGSGRNFSILWQYSDGACTSLLVIVADVVDSCEGAENYDCTANKIQRCWYIQPNAPPQSPPIAVPQSVQAPTIQVQPTARTPTADTSGNQRPFTKSETDITMYLIIAVIVLSLAVTAVYLIVKRTRNLKKSEKINSDPEESQKLLAVEVESDVDDIKGRGSYSIVRQVVKDGKKYALKKILTDTTDLYEEYKIMRQLNHHNILKVYEFNATSDTVPGLQAEICDCSLADRIGELTDREILSYIKQLAAALRFIQFKIPGAKAVIHCDINPRNILFIKDHPVAKYKDVMLLKLADFGLAKLVSRDAILPGFSPKDDEEAYKAKVMDIWTAPDVELHNKYSFVTDLYSFAVVCAQIMFRETIQSLEELNDKLTEAKIKSTTCNAQIAAFCLDIIDYKNQMAARDAQASGIQKKLVTKRPETANEVKAKLEEFMRVVKLQEQMLLASVEKDNDEKPEVVVVEH